MFYTLRLSNFKILFTFSNSLPTTKVTKQFLSFSEHVHQCRKATCRRSRIGPNRWVQRGGHLRRRPRVGVSHLELRSEGRTTKEASRTFRPVLCTHWRGIDTVVQQQPSNNFQMRNWRFKAVMENKKTIVSYQQSNYVEVRRLQSQTYVDMNCCLF